MLTKNFYRAIAAYLQNNSIEGGVRPDGTTGVVGVSALAGASNSSSAGFGMKNAMSMVNKTASYTQGVYLGSGTTPATPDDYALENIITNFSITRGTAVMNATENYVEWTVTHGISANTGSDVTISEIGLVCGTASNMYLVDHTVLETPITIPTGQSKQITYTIRLNYPTA